MVRDAAQAYGAQNPGKDGKPREVLESVTTFAGGGAPRFWFAVTPELQQPNYAQLVIRVRDKEDTPKLAGPLQQALSEKLPGAIADFRQLRTSRGALRWRSAFPAARPRAMPIMTTTSGRCGAAAEATAILQTAPAAARVRDDWGGEIMSVQLDVDPDRANLAGVTNQDVAASSASALNGTQVATARGRSRFPSSRGCGHRARRSSPTSATSTSSPPRTRTRSRWARWPRSATACRRSACGTPSISAR